MAMPRDEDRSGGVVDAGENGVFDCGCMLVAVGKGFSLRRCYLHRTAERLLAMLVDLEEHASRYGGVPGSADKLWARVREILTEALGPKYGLSIRFGAE